MLLRRLRVLLNTHHPSPIVFLPYHRMSTQTIAVLDDAELTDGQMFVSRIALSNGPTDGVIIGKRSILEKVERFCCLA